MSVLIANEAVDLMRDGDYNVFTREFDRIEPLPVPGNLEPQWIAQLEEQVAQMTGRMQKDIERMMASQSQVVKVPGLRSGRLHAPSLHRLKVNDDRIFHRKQEHKSKDTAVTLLVDNSGSMCGAKIVTAMVAAYALSLTLERVNVANEMLGFTTGDYGQAPRSVIESMHREIQEEYNKGVTYHRVVPIMMPIYKTFDERVRTEVKARIAYMANVQPGMGSNVDGESLEYAAVRLAQRREKRKVMIVLSDGQPSGGANVAPHLKQTVEKLVKSGIETIGIGIMDPAVKRFYPKCTVLQNISELPVQIMRELKAILTN
jgi:cobalamin biosynthesis protein CobT